jgi:hypothetical protein
MPASDSRSRLGIKWRVQRRIIWRFKRRREARWIAWQAVWFTRRFFRDLPFTINIFQRIKRKQLLIQRWFIRNSQLKLNGFFRWVQWNH